MYINKNESQFYIIYKKSIEQLSTESLLQNKYNFKTNFDVVFLFRGFVQDLITLISKRYD